MSYRTIEELNKVVEDFKNQTIERETWGHPEHLILAFYYLDKFEPEHAYSEMKAGIFKLLEAFEVDLSKEMPYHETLTRFWMETVREFRKDNPNFDVETLNALFASRDKNYPERFYSKELLYSEKARREYVEPDKLK